MRHQDVSLLIIFDAIMTEGSITRAADRLMMTQPAVSNAVARMRSAWKDELFIKNGRNIKPTLNAQKLWQQTRRPLRSLEEAVSPHSFDASSANRTFYISSADIGIDIVWTPLRKIIENEAPNINIYAVPYTILNGEDLLNNAGVELIFGPTIDMSDRINIEHLFNSRYVCVMRADHPLANKPLSKEAFASADHLLVSLSGDINSDIDDKLRQHGIERRIAMTVNHFSSIAPLLNGSNLIGIAPSIAIEKHIFSGELAVADFEIEIPSVTISYFWHQRQTEDQGLKWLRSHMSQIIKDRTERHYRQLDEYLVQH